MTSTSTSTRRRKFPSSLNGGEQQDPDDVRVGETHLSAPEGFERGLGRPDNAGDAGPDSGFDSGERTDERIERRDDPAAECTPPDGEPPSPTDTASRPRDSDHAR